MFRKRFGCLYSRVSMRVTVGNFLAALRQLFSILLILFVKKVLRRALVVLKGLSIVPGASSLHSWKLVAGGLSG